MGSKGVSISSPSGEGGENITFHGKFFPRSQLFPLVLLQAKAVRISVPPFNEEDTQEFPLVLLQAKAVSLLKNLS